MNNVTHIKRIFIMHLLIIEDETDILEALKRGFVKKGYTVTGSADGSEGFELAQAGGYDLIILDLNLPGMDGIDILKGIREVNKQQKILVLSARSDFSERIEGLDLGANDYLVKPFDFGELEARARNLLRRDFIQKDTVISVGGFGIDTAARRVFYGEGDAVELAPKEYRILEYLALKPGVPVSPEELIDHIWDGEDSLFSNAVKVHICQLRKKLAEFSGECIIHNNRGMGYLVHAEGGTNG